jgi:hypothetical protein
MVLRPRQIPPASAWARGIGPGGQARRHRRPALAPEPGYPKSAADLPMARQEAQCRLGTTFNDHAVISENRMIVIPADFDLKGGAPLGLRGHHGRRRDQQRCQA